jgi:predicted CoA-binding protein
VVVSNLIAEFVGLRRWAVVGVSNDQAKFGRRIFDDMRNAGYMVVPIHLSVTALDDGTQVYSTVSSITDPVEVVGMVIPPKAAPAVLRDVALAGATRVWFQPGATDQVALDLAQVLGIQVIAGGPCCMVARRRW